MCGYNILIQCVLDVTEVHSRRHYHHQPTTTTTNGNGNGNTTDNENILSLLSSLSFSAGARAGCLFDSPWLRLSHPNYTHRMNHYENEIAERLKHHLTRKNDTAPAAEAKADSSPPTPLEESGGGGGRAAAAAAENVARVEEGGRSSAKELAGATAAAGTAVQQCDVR